MDWKKHLFLGSIFTLIILFGLNYFLGWYSYNFETFFIVGLMIILGTILLDCDHPISTITWTLIGLVLIGLIYSVTFNDSFLKPSIFLLLLIFISAKFLNHRGVIHSWSFIILMSGIIYYFINLEVAIVGLIAMFSHLLFDGIPFKLI